MYAGLHATLFCHWYSIMCYLRYEGEWFQNDVEGHGVVEVDIPVIEPAPGSKYVPYFNCLILCEWSLRLWHSLNMHSISWEQTWAAFIHALRLEAKMRAQGKIIARDFLSPEDREWLEKDIEDMYYLADGNYEIPFYENEEWVRQFGRKPWV